MQWNRVFQIKENSNVNSAIQTQDGGFVLVGSAFNYGSPNDALIIKTNSIGIMEGYQTFGEESDNDYFYSIIKNADGSYILGGTQSIGFPNAKAWLVKIDPVSVSQQWKVEGSFVINVNYLDVNYPETLILTQNGESITGTSLGGTPYPRIHHN